MTDKSKAFRSEIWKYRLKNAVMTSFNTVKQTTVNVSVTKMSQQKMTEMFQEKKTVCTIRITQT